MCPANENLLPMPWNDKNTINTSIVAACNLKSVFVGNPRPVSDSLRADFSDLFLKRSHFLRSDNKKTKLFIF